MQHVDIEVVPSFVQLAQKILSWKFSHGVWNYEDCILDRFAQFVEISRPGIGNFGEVL